MKRPTELLFISLVSMVPCHDHNVDYDIQITHRSNILFSQINHIPV